MRLFALALTLTLAHPAFAAPGVGPELKTILTILKENWPSASANTNLMDLYGEFAYACVDEVVDELRSRGLPYPRYRSDVYQGIKSSAACHQGKGITVLCATEAIVYALAKEGK